MTKKMTKQEVDAKWAPLLKKIEIEDGDYNDTDPRTLTDLGTVKWWLQGTIRYIKQLEEHGDEFQMPFNNEQLKWALRAPVGDTKVAEVGKWLKASARMRDAACTHWTYEKEEKSA